MKSAYQSVYVVICEERYYYYDDRTILGNVSTEIVGVFPSFMSALSCVQENTCNDDYEDELPDDVNENPFEYTVCKYEEVNSTATIYRISHVSLELTEDDIDELKQDM